MVWVLLIVSAGGGRCRCVCGRRGCEVWYILPLRQKCCVGVLWRGVAISSLSSRPSGPPSPPRMNPCAHKDDVIAHVLTHSSRLRAARQLFRHQESIDLYSVATRSRADIARGGGPAVGRRTDNLIISSSLNHQQVKPYSGPTPATPHHTSHPLRPPLPPSPPPHFLPLPSSLNQFPTPSCRAPLQITTPVPHVR